MSETATPKRHSFCGNRNGVGVVLHGVTFELRSGLFSVPSSARVRRASFERGNIINSPLSGKRRNYEGSSGRRVFSRRRATRSTAVCRFFNRIDDACRSDYSNLERRVSDIIWLESNSTAGNSILTFQNNGTGTPAFLGSTLAGGIGVYDGTFALGPFDSDQNLITNHDGTLLFAVNSGSNSIAVFNITATGLTPVAGSPFPSGGTDPVSLGLLDDVLVVVNKDQDPAQDPNLVQPNYTTFRVSPSGALTPIPGSTVTVAYGSSPSQALVASHGPLVFGADFLGGLLAIVLPRSRRPLAPESATGAAHFPILPDRRRPTSRWACGPTPIRRSFASISRPSARWPSIATRDWGDPPLLQQSRTPAKRLAGPRLITPEPGCTSPIQVIIPLRSTM